MHFSGIFLVALNLPEWIDSFFLPGRSVCLKTIENVHTLLEMVFLNVQLQKYLPFSNDFRRRMHFSDSFIFLGCSFSFTICPTVTFFLGWKCYRIFPSDLICLIFKCLLKWFMQFLARDCSLTVWLGGFVTPVSCYFIMCCKLFHTRVESLVGSMDCINEFCFAANPCLMIDVHMYFSFTCPALYLCCCFLSHSHLLLFMCRPRNQLV